MNKILVPISIVCFVLLAFSQSKKPTPYIFPKLSAFPKMPSNPFNPVTVEGVKIGRHLFYDPILSSDSTVSCNTCHQQKNAFADNVRFSAGVLGAKLQRNTPPLFNLAWNEALFWDGRAKSVEAQVFFPVRDHLEMNLNWTIAVDRINNSDFYSNMFLEAFGETRVDSLVIANVIAQFERSIISYNTKLDKALRRELFLTDDELQGLELMNDQSKGNCLHCHTTDANFVGTTGKFSNNGLDAVFSIEDYVDKGRGLVTSYDKDVGRFKIPSLRNVAVTAPYMHDGRFNTLEEVLNFYATGVNKSVNIDPKMHFEHPRGVNLSLEEQVLIVSFLKALTDSVLIHSEAFSNPFK